jgi:peptide/nickel transport system ATP-binding protein
MSPILSVRNLHTNFRTQHGLVPALRGVSFDLEVGEILGLIGETGAGKSITSLTILRLLPPHAEIMAGEIIFNGRNLLEFSESQMRRVRGNQIAMVFQRYRESLNPVFTIGSQLTTVLCEKQGLSYKTAIAEAIRNLERVGIDYPKEVMSMYAHQLSGGMCQRVVIALALACNPSILIADELATGLDVVLQARILALIKDLVSQAGTSAILITHDLAIVAETCDRVVVMYRGEVAEHGRVEEVLAKPLHPYTKGLVTSVDLAPRGEELLTISGDPPNMFDHITGCSFHPRCPYVEERCRITVPKTVEVLNSHLVKCHLYDGITQNG